MGGKEKREKGWKMEKKRRKIEKGKVENLKWKKEKRQKGLRTFFFGIFYWEKSISRREKIRKKWLCRLRKNVPVTPLFMWADEETMIIWYGITWVENNKEGIETTFKMHFSSGGGANIIGSMVLYCE